MKSRKLLFALISVILCVSLTGCVNKDSEIKSRLIVQGIGVDKTDDNKYRLSLQVFNTAVSGGQDSGVSGNVTEIYTVDGDSVADAMRNATLITGKRPLYSHNWVIVISEAAAKDGIYSALDFFVRDYGMRSTVSLVLSSSSAEDIIRSSCGGSSIPAREIAYSMDTHKYNAKTVNVDLYNAVNLLNDPYTELYLPVVRRNKDESSKTDEVVVDGLAVFKGQYMSAKLPPDKIRGFLFVNNKIESGALVMKTQEFGCVTLEIIKNKTKISTEVKNGAANFNVLINCVCDISEIERSNTDLNKKSFKLMEAEASRQIKKESQTVINHCVRDLNCDVFRLGDRFLNESPDIFRKLNKEQWLLKSTFNVSVNVEIRRIGQKTAVMVRR